MFVSQHRAETMLDAVLKMEMQFVNVYANIMAIHMKAVAQSVPEIQIVQWARLAFETNALILVSVFAELKQCAPYQITSQSVHVHQEQPETHSDSV